HLPAQLARHRPRRRERGAGVVPYQPGLVERRAEWLGDLRDGIDRLALGGKEREARRIAAQVRAQLARRREEIPHLGQAARLERGAVGRGGGERGGEQRNVRGGRAAGLGRQRDQLGNEVEAPLGLGPLARRTELEHRL